MPTVRKSALSLSKKSLARNLGEDHSYDRTSSPDGKIESMVLMHSRMGIRIELNLNKCTLSLWISPQAGKSIDYHDRNFSCRDDNTSIFDRISFPELGTKGFVSCDYDPFHSVLNFGRQRLHIATLIDKPVVLLWTEAEEVVDFKSDKQDSLVKRSDRVFAVRHPDRGKVLDFVAALGTGTGRFWHQPEVDTGRSTYARVVLPAGQLLVIGGELTKEDVLALVCGIARKPAAALLNASEKKIAQALKPGSIIIKNNPEMQKLYDINKRHLLSVQDASGAVRAALKYVYYLIWTTDGAVTSTSMFQTGWQEFLRLWVEFLLSNPTSQDSPPYGRFFGQLANKITKREEFGVLCAIWPAFMYWAVTGDRRFVTGKYLKVMEDAVDWLERYGYDQKMGGMGFFYQGGGSEDPYVGSNDFGWDAAVGCPMSRKLYAPRHDGQLIVRSWEFGNNLNQYNMYLMLSALTTGAKSAAYRKKARGIERFLKKMLAEKVSAYNLLDDGRMVSVKSQSGQSEKGLLAVQNRSTAFFMPEFATLFLNRNRSFKAATEQSVINQMPCYYYGQLAGLDTEFVDEADIIKSIEVSLPFHVRPSKYIPMPYTMVEMMGAKDGEYHDIRPQAFSAGPFQAAVSNLAVRTMPFGIGLRATSHLAKVNRYEYRDGWLDIAYRGAGKVSRILLNAKPLTNTLQVPDSLMKSGANKVVVEMSDKELSAPTLVYSTVKLESVDVDKSVICYTVTAFCQNVLVFRDMPGDVLIHDKQRRKVKSTATRDGRHVFVEFEGRGVFYAEVAGDW